jgi:hypothetical protein
MGSQFGGIPVDQPQAAAPNAASDSQFGGIPAEPADFSTTVYGKAPLDFFTTLGKDIYNAPKSFMDIVTGHPIDEATKIGTALTEGRHQAYQQFKDSWSKGNHLEAFEHLLGAFPVLGPPLNAAMNEMRMPAAGQPPDETHQGLSYSGMAHAVESLVPFAIPALEEAAQTEVGQRTIQAVTSRIPQKIGTPPLVRNQLNPMEQANQEWLTQHPTEPPIQTPVSMQTGSLPAADFQGSVRQAMGGGYAETARQTTRQGVIARAQAQLEKISPEPVTPEEAGTAVSQKLAADLEQTRENLANEVSPNPTTPEQAGQKVIDAGRKQIQLFDKQADQAYKAAWQAEEDPRNIENVPVRDEDGGIVRDANGNATTEKMALPIDMTDIQHALQPIADRYAYTLSETDARASLGLKAMRQIINGPATKPASAAELDLGMLKDAARNENLPELRDTSQGLAAQSVKQLQQAIDAKMAQAAYPGWDPASGTPSPALTNLRGGRLATAQKYDVADTFAGLGRRNIDQLEPVGVHQRLTSAGDAGINQLRDIAKIVPDAMPDVGRAFIEGGGNWSKLGPETKKIIFGGDDNLISNLDDLYAKERRFGKLTQMEPVALFNKMTAARGRMVNLLRSISKETPEQIPQIARAWTQGMLDTITQKGDIHHTDAAWKSYFEMDPETKKILFPDPGQINDWNHTFFALQRLNREVNPSRSGYIMALNAMKRDVLRGAGMLAGGGFGLATGATDAAMAKAAQDAALGLFVGGAVEPIANATLARLLYDRRFTRLLTKGIQLQLRGDPRAALAAKSLSQMVYAARLPGETPEPPR